MTKQSTAPKELKPCPFCGMSDELRTKWPEDIDCEACGARVHEDAWNARPIEDALRSDAARYRWLRKHFRFANDSMRELWFDASLQPENGTAAAELDASIDKERAIGEAAGRAI